MNKSALATIGILVTTLAAFGQGTVNWSAISSGAMTAQTNTTQSGPLQGNIFFGGGSQGATSVASPSSVYYFALLYAPFTGAQAATPANLVELNAWQDTGLMATNSNIAGRLTPVSPNSTATVPWAAGVTNSIMLVGWSANLGNTWSQVSNVFNNWNSGGGPILTSTAFFGMSTTGYIAAGNADPGIQVFGTSPASYGLPINGLNTQLYALSLGDFIVPEPGTWTLLGLGGAMLLVRRQKK